MIRIFMLTVVILAFGLLSGVALMKVGYWGILAPHFRSWGEAQVLVDLVILAVLCCRWMRADSRTSGISAWLFIAITLVAGSFGPLLYLLIREIRSLRSAAPVAQPALSR